MIKQVIRICNRVAIRVCLKMRLFRVLCGQSQGCRFRAFLLLFPVAPPLPPRRAWPGWRPDADPLSAVSDPLPASSTIADQRLLPSLSTPLSPRKDLSADTYQELQSFGRYVRPARGDTAIERAVVGSERCGFSVVAGERAFLVACTHAGAPVFRQLPVQRELMCIVDERHVAVAGLVEHAIARQGSQHAADVDQPAVQQRLGVRELGLIVEDRFAVDDPSPAAT